MGRRRRHVRHSHAALKVYDVKSAYGGDSTVYLWRYWKRRPPVGASRVGDSDGALLVRLGLDGLLLIDEIRAMRHEELELHAHLYFAHLREQARQETAEGGALERGQHEGSTRAEEINARQVGFRVRVKLRVSNRVGIGVSLACLLANVAWRHRLDLINLMDGGHADANEDGTGATGTCMAAWHGGMITHTDSMMSPTVSSWHCAARLPGAIAEMMHSFPPHSVCDRGITFESVEGWAARNVGAAHRAWRSGHLCARA